MLAKDLRQLSDEDLYRKRSTVSTGSQEGDQLDTEIKRRMDLAGRSNAKLGARLNAASVVTSLLALMVACLSYLDKDHLQAPAIIEAKRLILKDANGNLVAWIGSASLADRSAAGIRPNTDLPLATVASGEVSGLFLFSQGRVAGSIIPTSGGAVLDIRGDGDSLAHITGDGLELLGRGGHLAADFKSWPFSFVDVHDRSGKVAWSSPYPTR